jgi:hypothetical protein
MDEKEIEELEALEKEALEERDSGEQEENVEETEKTVEEIDDEPTNRKDEIETEDDTGDSGDGHEDEPADSSEEDKSEEVKETDFKPIEVEVGGHKVTITSQEDLMAYVTKGAESFSAKPDKYSNEKAIIEQGNLTQDDLKLLIDAKNGSKEAIAKLAELSKVDVLDLEAEMASQYKSTFEPKIESEIDRVAGEILKDENHANDFRRISSNLPSDFMDAIAGNAEALKNFSGHIKSGLAQEVIPLAITAQMRYGGTFMDHYVSIGQKVSQNKQAPQRTMSDEELSMRKRASSVKSKTSQETKKIDNGDDVWNMTDEEFAEKYGA